MLYCAPALEPFALHPALSDRQTATQSVSQTHQVVPIPWAAIVRREPGLLQQPHALLCTSTPIEVLRLATCIVIQSDTSRGESLQDCDCKPCPKAALQAVCLALSDRKKTA